MRLSVAAAALAVAISLVGCAQKWSKTGGTPDEFDAMKASCQAQAYSQFPPQLQQVQASNGYYTPVTTNCYPLGYGESCYQSGGQFIPPVVITVDTNATPRRDAVRSCFYSNGWSPAGSGDQAVPASAPTPATTCNAGFDCD